MTRGRVTGFFHAGVTVSDMNGALRFYRDTLGLKLDSLREIDEPYPLKIAGVPPGRVTIALLKVPGSDSLVELLEYRGVENRNASTPPSDYGTGHFCLWVDDIDAMHDRLHANGYETRSREPVVIPVGPRKGGKASYAVDPDGYHIELFMPPSHSTAVGDS